MTTQTDQQQTNQEYQERFLLAGERIRQIPEEARKLSFASDYFRQTASFLSIILDTYDTIAQDRLRTMSLEELQQQNHALYADILPENYLHSYANPDYAAKTLGNEFGPLLCAVYAEMRGTIVYAFEQNLCYLTIAMELYLEIYGILSDDNPSAEEIHSALYYYCFDYTDITVFHRTEELLNPNLDFCTKLVMESDLQDLRYLYYWGEYVSDNEYRTAEYLNTLPLTQIQDMARTYTEGYRKGFETYRIDLSKKKTVNIRYTLGFERIVREAIGQFESIGLRTIIYRQGIGIIHRLGVGKAGFHGGSANKQYDYDHRMDMALIFDKAYADRRLDIQRQAYEQNKILASEYAGPALIETFGETPWNPQEKQTIPQYYDKQQTQKIAYQAAAGMLANEFIPGEEVSFTIIAYPVPEIGHQYPEIFDATVQVNTLDPDLYQEIQTKIIEALDQGIGIQITGRGENQTDLYVALTPMTDPAHQTRFENCLADVNIPLGEVFTSPQLLGTHGILHVTRSFLNGLKYENIRLTFTDGIVTDYSCRNYDDPEKNKKYIRDNLLFQHETLPMGEFAIGTNTTAYAMGRKYQISHLLPILIEEKTGPHFAIGDTCFSHEEDMHTYNPDGKEMIAKENDYSRLRHTEEQKAYFNCHTDITIPYHELGSITVYREDGSQLPIIQDGRFVLPGTEKLNKPLE